MTQEAIDPQDDRRPHFSMPFFNTRSNAEESCYWVDCYNDVRDPAYVLGFIQAWQAVDREMRHLGYSCKDSHLSFTVCPGCGLIILTSRTVGKTLCCRNCNVRHEVTPSERTDLQELLGQIETALEDGPGDA